MKSTLLILSLLFTQMASAATTEIDGLDWELKKEKGGIKVLSANVPESEYSAYLAITVINARTDELVDIIRDPSTCSEWAYRCGQSYRYGQESPNIDLVYTSSSMPFPVKDRDTLARITWHEDPDTKVVRAVGVATTNIMEPKARHVRIENATVIWELTPLDDGKTLVRTFGHADPGGELPVWLTNQMSTDVPVQSLNGLRELVAKNASELPQTNRTASITSF